MTCDTWHVTHDTWFSSSSLLSVRLQLFWYWYFYPHKSRDSVSPVCRIYFNNQDFRLNIFTPKQCKLQNNSNILKPKDNSPKIPLKYYCPAFLRLTTQKDCKIVTTLNLGQYTVCSIKMFTWALNILLKCSMWYL